MTRPAYRLRPLVAAWLIAVAAAFAVACGSSSETADTPPAPPATAQPAATATQPPAPTPVPQATPAPAATAGARPAQPTATAQPTFPPVSVPSEGPGGPGGVIVSLEDGTMARYVIGEQLANRDLPNDAIGETAEVAGSIVFDKDGNVVEQYSALVVDVSTLVSDSNRRDNYLRGNSLETSAYPEARFQTKEVIGLPWPLPKSGEATFQLAGDFTVRDVTKPVTWDVTVTFGPEVRGQAVTVFTFDYFEMSKPRLAFILSLDDEIRLELDIVALVTPPL